MPNLAINGRFKCVEVASMSEVIFYNEITQAGIFRILDLMGGLSAGTWEGIRLVSSNPSIFVQKDASISRTGNVLQSTAVFPAPELVFETVEIQMFASGVMVARAPASLVAGQTYYVTREDSLKAE